MNQFIVNKGKNLSYNVTIFFFLFYMLPANFMDD
jgi:hypothetical protein